MWYAESLGIGLGEPLDAFNSSRDNWRRDHRCSPKPVEVLPAKHPRDHWKTRKGSSCKFTVVNDFAAAGCMPVRRLRHIISCMGDLQASDFALCGLSTPNAGAVAAKGDIHDAPLGCRNRPFIHAANYGTSWAENSGLTASRSKSLEEEIFEPTFPRLEWKNLAISVV